MFNIDFDAPQGTEAELRAYLRDMWTNMRADLGPIFAQCFGYDKVHNAEDFANFIIGCQVETTMPFNDYWAEAPALPTVSKIAMAATFLAAAGVAGVAFYALLNVLGLIAGQGWSAAYRAEAAAIIVLAILAGAATFAIFIRRAAPRRCPWHSIPICR